MIYKKKIPFHIVGNRFYEIIYNKTSNFTTNDPHPKMHTYPRQQGDTNLKNKKRKNVSNLYALYLKKERELKIEQR